VKPTWTSTESTSQMLSQNVKISRQKKGNEAEGVFWHLPFLDCSFDAEDILIRFGTTFEKQSRCLGSCWLVSWKDFVLERTSNLNIRIRKFLWILSGKYWGVLQSESRKATQIALLCATQFVGILPLPQDAENCFLFRRNPLPKTRHRLFIGNNKKIPKILIFVSFSPVKSEASYSKNTLRKASQAIFDQFLIGVRSIVLEGNNFRWASEALYHWKREERNDT